MYAQVRCLCFRVEWSKLTQINIQFKWFSNGEHSLSSPNSKNVDLQGTNSIE